MSIFGRSEVMIVTPDRESIPAALNQEANIVPPPATELEFLQKACEGLL
jgi:hypothetical protein